jgi:transcriptional regulator with XRE-family HTH domain
MRCDVTIRNQWKSILKKAGAKQVDLASEVGVNYVQMSNVVSGNQMLPKDKFLAICGILDIAPEAVYSTDVLSAVYGINRQKPKPTSVSVRISVECAELIDKKVNAGLARDRRDFIEQTVRYMVGDDDG